MKFGSIAILLIAFLHETIGCQFYPPGEYLRFVRVPEDLKVGNEVLRVEVHPRRHLKLLPVDKNEDVNFFSYRDVNRTTVSLILARTLEDLVDTDNPRNVLKFRLACDFDDGEDVISSSLSITVYVEDINDHAPVFEKAPYQLTVDEFTPVGLTIFRGIQATDRDKPYTPNSDVQYAITAGNDRGKFALDNSHQAALLLNKALDYDTGDREFILTVTASDRGVPQRSTNATVKIVVRDNDDLSPKFTKGIYRTKLTEYYPLTGERLHVPLNFSPPIYAYDQDIAINAPIRYDIIAGNDRRLFFLNKDDGTLFLEKEIDLESEKSLPGNTFVLQIQASQIDSPTKAGVARVEIEVMDLNDNLPEFEVDFYNISIVENLPNGFSVLQIIATDQDQGDNGEFTYQLDDKSKAFTLDSRNGWLTVRDQAILDREKRSSVKMSVFAKEKTLSIVTDNKNSASYVNIEVTLLDANDNNPTFIPNNIYDFSVSLSAKRGDPIGQIHAIDPDLGRNGLVSYSIQKAANATLPFRVDSKTGQLSVGSTTLTQGRHLLFVEAADQPLNPSERRSSLAVVTIEVVNDHLNGDVPSFVSAPYEFWVGANVDIGTSIGQIRVSDPPKKNPLMYDLLHSYHEGVPFAVEERSGTITVVDKMVKFDRTIYDFEAVVTNNKDVTLVTNVTIHIVDPKDNKNIFHKDNGNIPIEFHVRENLENMLIGRLTPNSTTKFIKFTIANQKDVTDHISISPNGTLYTEKSLDREKRDNYRLTIIAEYTNRGKIAGSGIYQAIIYVDDENDNAPKFERDAYEGRIKENSGAARELDMNYLIHVSDPDIGVNGQFTLTLYGEGSEKFRLDKSSGKIYFNSGSIALDREDKDVYNLRLVAKDKGGLSSEALLTIIIEDENDNPPIFAQMIIEPLNGIEVEEEEKLTLLPNKLNASIYALSQSYIKSRSKNRIKISPIISLPEDIAVGTLVARLRATDRDSGENAAIKYEMLSETFIPNENVSYPFHITQFFMVNPVGGDILIVKSLPAESEFRINVTATDVGGLKDSIVLRILVRDVNDHVPVFKKSWYTFNVEESNYAREPLGQIEAIDSDFGSNANISYKIHTFNNEVIPFKISDYTGILSVDGEVDRESRDKYSFSVVAKDNPILGKRLSSTVNVDVNVVDLNDNSPTFYGYDDLIETSKPKRGSYTGHQFTSLPKIPVYYAAVPENSPIGTPVTKVFANDSDFTGNGNGLILFDIPYRKHRDNLFTVDSKEGVVTTIGRLDFEKEKSHNITIIASDLGSPSLSSTAMLIITVIDVPEDVLNIERPVFAHRYYEVEVEENVPVPLPILTLNVTEPYKNHKLRYSIVGEKYSEVKRTFVIDSRNGTLFIVEQPDRERKAYYELKIRLDQYKVGRDMTVMVYPVTSERLGDLGLNEVKVIVRVTDLNDNIPKFTIGGRPIIAAIPTSANFGHHIIKLQAIDPDLGLNGEIRYQILGRADNESRRFSIDPITGQVRAIGSFGMDAGKVYGFDVKATDRKGADDGKSSIANVFVYVLDEDKQLVMVLDSKPTDVEKSMENITVALYNVTGFDVRIRKLEPHSERNQVDNSATDMYLYAVDPKLNVVVDMEDLQKALLRTQSIFEHHLDGQHRVLALASGLNERINVARSQRVLLSTLEVGVVVLGCIVFIGALTTAVCVMCVRRRKTRSLRKTFAHVHQPVGFPITTLGGKPAMFPTSFAESMRYNENMDRMSTGGGGGTSYTSGGGGQGSGHHQQPHGVNGAGGGFQHHEPHCPRYKTRRSSYSGLIERARSVGGIETSLASLHSSGKDSGIVDGTQCLCGQSTTQSSEDSSNGYEDSLQSITARHLRMASEHRSSHRLIQSIHPPHNHSNHNNNNHNLPNLHSIGQHRRRSFTDEPLQTSSVQMRMQQTAMPIMLTAQAVALRKSNDRLFMMNT